MTFNKDACFFEHFCVKANFIRTMGPTNNKESKNTPLDYYQILVADWEKRIGDFKIKKDDIIPIIKKLNPLIVHG